MTSNHPIVAQEGWPLLAVLVLALAVSLAAGLSTWLTVGLAVVFAAALLLFRDPVRSVPSSPNGVIAPVDGRVLQVELARDAVLPGEWMRLSIRPNPLGAYTVRAPIEGKVLNPRVEARRDDGTPGPSGLWLRSEERDNVVLVFRGPGWLPRPQAFVNYGERLGQGQRFAYLRLAPKAELYLPAGAAMEVAPGDRIRAGEQVVANLQRS